MATRPLPQRPRVMAHPLPARRRKPRFRLLRRLFVLLIALFVVTLVAYIYVLQVYAPGLRYEARNVPSLVRGQLAAHGATYQPLRNISSDLRHAIVAVEDRRFYIHPGIDPIGMVRALQVNFTHARVDQGGSTLEEQLVKRAIVGSERSWHQKLRTIGLAWAVDQEFSKDQILEMYLNAAYYGQGAYGVGEAARVYFSTDSAHLTLAQAAFLAALPQAPSVYGSNPRDPVVVKRWRTVLTDMANSQYVTPSQARDAGNVHLTFAFGG